MGSDFWDERAHINMHELELFETRPIRPLETLGFTHRFLELNFTTIFNTWVVLGILTILLLVIRWYLPKKNSIVSYLATKFVQTFIDLCTQNLGFFSLQHTLFIMVLFTFIFMCNILGILPGFEKEPTGDLNTTLALGIISSLYIQYYAIRTHGLLAYCKEFFTPIFLFFPINIIGELATIVSISFRLYGNIFGGSVISIIYKSALAGSPFWELFGLVSGINLIITLFFGLFEGFIQAFVFSTLSLTYLALSIAGED